MQRIAGEWVKFRFVSIDEQWLEAGFELVIGFIEHFHDVTTNNYDTPKSL
jgi:hypothetical protein